MDPMFIFWTALVLFGLVTVFALLLFVAKEKLRVEIDPRIEDVNEALPAANCGGCGYAGCMDFAKAVVEGKAPVDGCPVGGPDCAAEVAKIMGIVVDSSAPMRPVINCGACASDKLGMVEYDGIASCHEAHILGTTQKCIYGCLGYGDCIAACNYDAIHVCDGRVVVDYRKCIGCGACVKACPRGVVAMVPFKQDNMLVAACSNTEKMKDVKGVCSIGCVGCGMCKKFAPDVFDVVNNNAVVLYGDYSGDGDFDNEGLVKVFQKCPAKMLLYYGKDGIRSAKEMAAQLAPPKETVSKTDA